MIPDKVQVTQEIIDSGVDALDPEACFICSAVFNVWNTPVDSGFQLVDYGKYDLNVMPDKITFFGDEGITYECSDELREWQIIAYCLYGHDMDEDSEDMERIEEDDEVKPITVVFDHEKLECYIEGEPRA